MTRSLLLVFFICFTAFAGLTHQGEAAEFSPKSTFYQIEYLKPVSGDGDPAFIYITFSVPVSPDLAERFLRQEIDRASNYSSPRDGIMAYALVQTSSNSAEDTVKLPDGSNFLSIRMIRKKSLLRKSTILHNVPRPNQARQSKLL